ncbi:response regulator transcription factor [Eubacterium oxidoreducens]|uniref:Stage 0 sporulation protein A homolog n=1 Tax=Eubacterium oxidoreducens TaxID=1732 RepID=A0A1G6B5E7_EUBOX|nr:response regulator [Eubacterium oxidoreducens]SDB15812.1 two-component system, response regulator YesN [Eubacterium oxidoreducens]
MKKVIMADDEAVILNGLKKMIPWEKLDLTLVDEAENGNELLDKIMDKHPQIVISDIKMPGLTGLEVVKKVKEAGNGDVKFIFISGFQEFSYAQEALAQGAVDYLLKPVGESDLEDSLQKAIALAEEHSVSELFKETEDEIEVLFHKINEGNEVDSKELKKSFEASQIDLTNKIFVGISFGILPPDIKRLRMQSLTKYHLTQFSIFNRLTEYFKDKRLGFAVKKDEDVIHMIAVLPREETVGFFERYIQPIRSELEAEYDVDLHIGIGMRTENITQLKNVYKTAKFAFANYFFEERAVLDFEHMHKDYKVSFEEYSKQLEEVFQSILLKDGCVLEQVDSALLMIHEIHYGNPYAVKTRVINMVDELSFKMKQYSLLPKDGEHGTEELQTKIENSISFSQLHKVVMKFYERLVAEIYQNDRVYEASSIEQVKKYIREHYMEDLSVKKVAQVACVSQNYFSAMFKKETGENFKSYLTGIRMAEAMKLLLDTDMKTYQIGEAVGYNNVRRFVDAFRAKYKMSPMDYKKSLR